MKFILTRELGRLAKWLRILGYDTVYFKQDNLSSLIIQALREERIVLTRNQRLIRPGGVKIIFVEAEKVRQQITQILQVLHIKPQPGMMFSRCILCNEALVDIAKESVRGEVPEYVYNNHEHFIACPKCRRIYWRGTHWGNVQAIIKEIGGNPKSQYYQIPN